MTSLTIQTVLGRPADWSVTEAHASFDRMLFCMNSVLLTALASKERLPGGIGGAVARGMNAPTSGGLRDLARVLATHAEDLPSVSRLAKQLQDECREGGWCARFVVLRNRVAHAANPEAAMEEMAKLLHDGPDFSSVGEFRISVDGNDLLWVDADASHSVWPLIRLLNGKPDWPGTLSTATSASDDGHPPLHLQEIRDFVADLRCRDPQLDQPGAADLIAKARRLPIRQTTGQTWWATGRTLQRKGAPHVIVDPAVLPLAFPNYAVSIDLDAGEDADCGPGEIISDTLGFAEPLSITRLCELVDAAETSFLITIDASRVSSRGFLKILEWLADLSDPNLEGTMRRNPQVVVGRSRKRLAEDEERFWDRIPPGISKILRLRPTSIHYRLPAFCWPATPGSFQ